MTGGVYECKHMGQQEVGVVKEKAAAKKAGYDFHGIVTAHRSIAQAIDADERKVEVITAVRQQIVKELSAFLEMMRKTLCNHPAIFKDLEKALEFRTILESVNLLAVKKNLRAIETKVVTVLHQLSQSDLKAIQLTLPDKSDISADLIALALLTYNTKHAQDYTYDLRDNKPLIMEAATIDPAAIFHANPNYLLSPEFYLELAKYNLEIVQKLSKNIALSIFLTAKIRHDLVAAHPTLRKDFQDLERFNKIERMMRPALKASDGNA